MIPCQYRYACRLGRPCRWHRACSGYRPDEGIVLLIAVGVIVIAGLIGLILGGL